MEEIVNLLNFTSTLQFYFETAEKAVLVEVFGSNTNPDSAG